MRRKVIAGNWKMNMLPNEAINFIEELTPLVSDTKNEVILCVPYTDLFYSLLNVQGTNIKIGAQNMHWEEKGAYTGEVSAQMLKSIGVEYVIIGHSERRQYFAETDETVNKKVKSALAVGLKPIICVGETLEQRESGQTEAIVTSQIEKALDGVSAEDLEKIIVAYEPIWAIGTGKTATKEDAKALLDIYKYYVEQTTITFEYETPSVEEFERRIENTLKKYPYLVEEEDGKIYGYTYAGPFKERAAYDWSVETTI